MVGSTSAGLNMLSSSRLSFLASHIFDAKEQTSEGRKKLRYEIFGTFVVALVVVVVVAVVWGCLHALIERVNNKITKSKLFSLK